MAKRRVDLPRDVHVASMVMAGDSYPFYCQKEAAGKETGYAAKHLLKCLHQIMLYALQFITPLFLH
jgi:hypothetical protein